MRPLEVGRDDLARCYELLRAGSKTFSVASKLFPQNVRDRATVLYAFCRVTDDRIDDDPNASQKTVDLMRRRLDKAYLGRPENDAVDRAFAGLLQTVSIPRELPELLFEGMEWDIHGHEYETIGDLYAYAARVAGTVGAMMTLVMGGSGGEVLARACDLGVAMQLTNVARDVGDDARMGRIYLPRTWMEAEGIDAQVWLKDPRPTEPLGRVVARLLTTADVLYQRADHGVTLLPRNCRVAVRAARLVYADIGRFVARRGFDSVTSRAFVPTWRKLWLVLRALDAPWSRPSPLGEPPLPETMQLVTACSQAS